MSVTTPKGFVAAGTHCGIKESGAPDLALVATESRAPVAAAGVFTQNVACAGPVRVSRAHLDATNGRAAAVVLNSGNANCATGDDVDVAQSMCELTARELGCAPEDVLVCSTGLIGIALDRAPLEKGIPSAAAMLARDGGGAAAHAIMTTDTVAKQVVVEAGGYTVAGMAKGSAMLAPNMATMLAVLTTDAVVDGFDLHALLADAVSTTFNRIVVDGCTSTNDTVLLLASGASHTRADVTELTEYVRDACGDLAMQMARDAEGHTKVVTIEILDAADERDAERAARLLAGSLLVKSSFYGADPYWGRVLSELGVSGVAIDVDTVTIAYDDVVVAKGLAPTGADAKPVLEQPEFTLTCRLGTGDAGYRVITNDLSHAYIDENMRTS